MTAFKDKKIAYLDNKMKIYEAFRDAVEDAQILYDSKCKSASDNKAIDEAHDVFRRSLKHATQTRNDSVHDLGAAPNELDFRAGC